jgi:hypothetical protein
MTSRKLSVAAFLAGTALFCLPSLAQTGSTNPQGITQGTGTTPGSMGTPRTTGPANSPGTMQGTTQGTGTTPGTMGTPRAAMGTQNTMQGSSVQGGTMQGAPRMRGAAGERQMTECLNMAAAQGGNYAACR